MCDLCVVAPSRRNVLGLMAAAPLFAALPRTARASTGILNYRAAFGTVRTEDGRAFVVIRRFERDGARLALTVDPATLETAIRDEAWLAPDNFDPEGRQKRSLADLATATAKYSQARR